MVRVFIVEGLFGFWRIGGLWVLRKILIYLGKRKEGSY